MLPPDVVKVNLDGGICVCGGERALIFADCTKRHNSLSKVRPELDRLYYAQLIFLTFSGGAVALANHLTQEISTLAAINVGLSVPALFRTGAEAKVRSTKKRKTDKDSKIN